MTKRLTVAQIAARVAEAERRLALLRRAMQRWANAPGADYAERAVRDEW